MLYPTQNAKSLINLLAYKIIMISQREIFINHFQRRFSSEVQLLTIPKLKMRFNFLLLGIRNKHKLRLGRVKSKFVFFQPASHILQVTIFMLVVQIL